MSISVCCGASQVLYRILPIAMNCDLGFPSNPLVVLVSVHVPADISPVHSICTMWLMIFFLHLRNSRSASLISSHHPAGDCLGGGVPRVQLHSRPGTVLLLMSTCYLLKSLSVPASLLHRGNGHFDLLMTLCLLFCLYCLSPSLPLADQD